MTDKTHLVFLFILISTIVFSLYTTVTPTNTSNQTRKDWGNGGDWMFDCKKYILENNTVVIKKPKNKTYSITPCDRSV